MSMKHRVPPGRMYFLVMARVNYVNSTEGSARAVVDSRHGHGKLCQWNRVFC